VYISKIHVCGLGENYKEVLLGLSVAWSFKTAANTYLKIKTLEKKNMLTSVAKLALRLRGAVMCATAVVCTVAFFGPSLGAWGVLAHWKAEFEFEFGKDLIRQVKGYWGSDIIDLVFRGEQGYEAYTIIFLRTTGIIFIVLNLLNITMIYAIKEKISRDFKDATFPAKIQHSVESIYSSDCFQDWDDSQKDLNQV
jgi:hypothetical protein